MGASTFEHYVSETDPHKAFKEAVKEASYEHGHGGYTGTIAEKHEFTIIQNKPLPFDAANALVEQLISNDDPRTVNITIKNPTPHEHLFSSQYRKLAAEKLKLKPNEEILDVTVVKEEAKYAREVKRTQGEMVTRYYVQSKRSYGPSGNREGHTTLAAARAEMEKLLAVEPRGSEPGVQLEIIGITKRADGSPLVTGERKRVKETIELRVEIASIEASQDVDGWLFFGWASD